MRQRIIIEGDIVTLQYRDPIELRWQDDGHTRVDLIGFDKTKDIFKIVSSQIKISEKDKTISELRDKIAALEQL